MSVENIEKKIKSLTKEKKITLKSLCQTIGLTEQGLNSTFRNKSIKVDTLEKVAKAFNVPITTFFDPLLEVDNNEMQSLNRRIRELESMLKNSVSHSEIEKLEIEIFKNIENGKGLIYLNYNSAKDEFDTKYDELKKPLTDRELRSIAMEKVFGRTLEEIERDTEPRID